MIKPSRQFLRNLFISEYGRTRTKKKFVNQKFTAMKNLINNKLIFICLGLILFISGCYTIAYVIQPSVIDPESAFNVTICVHPVLDEYRDDYLPNYGILGILLPEGWTVVDSVKYTLNMEEPYDPQSGFFTYNDSVVSFLDSSFSKSPTGYYWWGAKTFEQISLLTLDEGFVYISILPDSTVGEFNLKYALGDDSEYYKIKPEDPFGIRDSTELLPIEVVLSDVSISRQNDEWKVYPNPSNGEIFVQQSNMIGEVTMKLYDLNGKLQKSAVLKESLSRLDLNDISKGTYVISLEKEGKIKTKKLIVQ